MKYKSIFSPILNEAVDTYCAILQDKFAALIVLDRGSFFCKRINRSDQSDCRIWQQVIFEMISLPPLMWIQLIQHELKRPSDILTHVEKQS